MIKNMYEIKTTDSDNIIRVWKVCGATLEIALQKFQKQYPTAIIFKHTFLYSYED